MSRFSPAVRPTNAVSTSTVANWFGNQFVTYVAGSYESIATTVVGSGGQTTITFSSIPSTYTHLQLRTFARANYAANIFSLGIRYNSDSGTNYTFHNIYGNGTNALANGFTGYTYDYTVSALGTSTSNVFAASVMDILDYANTNKFKTIRTLDGGDVNGSGGSISLSSCLWRSTAAINSISISTGGFGDLLQYSHFALYGIKGA
jgi:hypothetical protein